MVTGATQNSLWLRACRQAAGDQLAGDRTDRVWMFFEADPARPRVWEQRKNTTTTADRARAIVGTALFGLTFGYIGLLVMQHGYFDSVAALALTAAGYWAAAWYDVRWRGIRRLLRDEIVDVYRESRIPAPRVKWLVRSRIQTLKENWQSGVLWRYHSEHRWRGAPCASSAPLRCLSADGGSSRPP